MIIRLHKNATTTPATRAYIQSSSLSVAALAAELGVSEDTIRRWTPMATPNCPTCGRSNCSRQDGRIMRLQG
ncbi:hypothetical protein [Tepidimonas sp. HKU79]|uniref:hypothetical protein n=1 Tax=Tepidimonas sp. HKU79 TaxID=3414505 RepID=UPI003C7DE489